MQHKWFEIKGKAGTGRSEIYIYGVIVDYKWDEEDTSAREFIDALKGLGDIDLHINSPGGSVWAANAIYNALLRHQGRIDVYVDGLAASSASLIAMAGRIIMPANAMIMIHDPWSFAIGTASEMRKAAEMLDKSKEGMIAAYKNKSGKDEAEISSLMSAETWLTAAEAVAMGFADEMEEPVQMAAYFDLSRYRNVPAAMKTPPKGEDYNHTSKGGSSMKKTVPELINEHPDLVADIEQAARSGMVAQADATQVTAEAVAAERSRILGLHAATHGEEAGNKFAAVVAAGLDAEQATALGITIGATATLETTLDETSRAAILQGLKDAAPEGLKGAQPTGEQAERAAAVSAIAAGGSRK